MVQIMLNYLYIFIIPIIIGFAVRFFTRKIKRAYWATVFFLVLSFVAWIIVYVVPSKGSEMHGIWALQATAAAIGSLVTGIAVWLKNSGSR
jgi:uncharacterized membrane protein YedE/YeeE